MADVNEMEDEDEECLTENNPLNVYLKGLGYTDFSTSKSKLSKETAIKYISSKASYEQKPECLEKDVADQIEILLRGQLLFEEDMSNIEKLMSNFKIVDNGMLKSMLQGSYAAVMLIIGVCLYWLIGGFVFIILSAFYAYQATDYLWQKHFNQKRLRNLMSALKSNYLILKKTFHFIQENDSLLQNNFSLQADEMKGITTGFEFYEVLKKDFAIAENEIVRLLSKATQKLLLKMPLYEYIENPQYYLCNSEKFSEVSDLSKLHQFYLLIQSEFLQRLALSLIPNLQMKNKEDYKVIYKIINETTYILTKLENKLTKKFKFAFINGIHVNSPKSRLKLSTSKDAKVDYAAEFVLNIHDTSNTLQDLLIKSRIIENNISNYKLSQNITDELVKIQNDLVACQKNISDSVILLQKLNQLSSSEPVKKLKEEKESENVYEKENKIIVGYTNLDPEVEDEIFEAYFNNEETKSKCIDDDYDFVDNLKKKLEKEYSKKVLKELKTKLIEKAKDWEIREANALSRKANATAEDKPKLELQGDDPLKASCDFTSNKLDFNLSENLVIDISNEESTLRYRKKCNSDLKLEEVDELKIEEFCNDNAFSVSSENENEEEEEDCFRLTFKNPNVNFLNGISQARKMILKSGTQEEELFCDTGENSEDEESVLTSKNEETFE